MRLQHCSMPTVMNHTVSFSFSLTVLKFYSAHKLPTTTMTTSNELQFSLEYFTVLTLCGLIFFRHAGGYKFSYLISDTQKRIG